MSDNILEVRGLLKGYPGFSLDSVSFALPKGSIMGLIGANGAGKSTTIRCILNLTQKDGGEVHVFGMDASTNETRIKQDLGVVFDENCFPECLRAPQVSRILKNIYSGWDEEYYQLLLKNLSIPTNKTIKEFSRGMKMKLSLAAALAHRPKLLILDEPTSGLDPIVREEILDLFLEFIQDEEHGILLSSHITTDLEKIADYITFINQGKVVLSEEKNELLQEYGMLKGTLSDLNRIDSADLAHLRKNRFGFEALVKPAEAVKRKYPGLLVDRVGIEEIMVFLAAGNKAEQEA